MCWLCFQSGRVRGREVQHINYWKLLLTLIVGNFRLIITLLNILVYLRRRFYLIKNNKNLMENLKHWQVDEEEEEKHEKVMNNNL